MARAGEPLTVVIDGGHARFVYDDALAGLLDEGRATVRRASHVEPAPGGGWQADMTPALELLAEGCDCPRAAVRGSECVACKAGGDASLAILGPFRLRGEALAAERAWLREHGF